MDNEKSTTFTDKGDKELTQNLQIKDGEKMVCNCDNPEPIFIEGFGRWICRNCYDDIVIFLPSHNPTKVIEN